MSLSLAERQSFLAEPHVAALALSADDGRAPLNVPIWYSYSPGGELWFLTGRDSVKGRLLRTHGRCTLMVQRLTPTVRYVSVEGPIEIGEPGPDDDAALARRYLPPEAVEPYLAHAADLPPEIRVRVTPEHWLSADLGAF